ncbi:hypothetical protein [Tenacibaculum ovolyticum]|uniref:hypothetical protein n=1 Tax=Tenacibaculum ovolyticum TaxID=104270 RepID=UPI000419B892|nr:hypothetical protein [Tenacibaculum ovolyticum]
MKIASIIVGLVMTLSLLFVNKTTTRIVKLESCYYKGKKLYGKIKLVENQNDADLKVKIVNSFPDLKVKFVENFADECGEWQIVENNEDLKVYITESFPDIKIQPVTSSPGLVK